MSGCRPCGSAPARPGTDLSSMATLPLAPARPHALPLFFFLSSCKHTSSLDLKLLSCFCKFIYHYTPIAEQKVSQCVAEPIGSVAFFCTMSCGIETLWCQLLARNLSIFVCNNMLFLYYAFIINWQHFQWFSYFLNNQICVIGNGTS